MLAQYAGLGPLAPSLVLVAKCVLSLSASSIVLEQGPQVSADRRVMRGLRVMHAADACDSQHERRMHFMHKCPARFALCEAHLRMPSICSLTAGTTVQFCKIPCSVSTRTPSTMPAELHSPDVLRALRSNTDDWHAVAARPFQCDGCGAAPIVGDRCARACSPSQPQSSL
jgi:hypothetical protein